MATGPISATIKIKKSTRDMVIEYGSQFDLTADEVIRAGVEALRWERKRKRAQRDAVSLSQDPAYLAEIAQVQKDLFGPVRAVPAKKAATGRKRAVPAKKAATGRKRAVPAKKAAPAPNVDAAAVRRWAKENGLPVANRGAIKDSVVQEFVSTKRSFK